MQKGFPPETSFPKTLIRCSEAKSLRDAGIPAHEHWLAVRGLVEDLLEESEPGPAGAALQRRTVSRSAGSGSDRRPCRSICWRLAPKLEPGNEIRQWAGHGRAPASLPLC